MRELEKLSYFKILFSYYYYQVENKITSNLQ